MTLRIIAGKYKGRLLKSPKGSSTRPTQSVLREALFNICQQEIEGANLLDLFAGSGAIGFEALSRGASHVTFVEKERSALIALKDNIALLDVASQTTLMPCDASTALTRLTDSFHLIYIDPPYSLPTTPILNIILARNLLTINGHLFVEERHDPKKQALPFTSERLNLKDSRRFGTALLHHYIFIE